MTMRSGNAHRRGPNPLVTLLLVIGLATAGPGAEALGLRDALTMPARPSVLGSRNGSFSSQALALPPAWARPPASARIYQLAISAAQAASASSDIAEEDVTVIRDEHSRPFHERVMQWGTNLFDQELDHWFEMYPKPTASKENRRMGHRLLMRQVAADVWNSPFAPLVLAPLIIAGGWAGGLGGVVLAIVALQVGPWVALVAGVHWIGKQYVMPGSATDFERIALAVEAEEKKGVRTLICLAGEQAATKEESDAIEKNYITLAQKCGERWKGDPPFKRQVSIKLSALQHDFSNNRDEVTKRMARIAVACRDAGLYLMIDGEYFKERDAQIDVLHRLQEMEELRDWDGLGVMIQTYFDDTGEVIDRLIKDARAGGHKVGIRIGKGAYYDEEKEKGNPVWSADDPVESQLLVDRAYRDMTVKLLENTDAVYPMIASMNPREQAWAYTVAARFGVDPDAWESQMLYGMQPHLAQRLVDRGQPLRKYMLFGDTVTALKYFKRRRTEITGRRAISRRMFDRRVPARKLAHIDPVEGDRLEQLHSYHSASALRAVGVDSEVTPGWPPVLVPRPVPPPAAAPRPPLGVVPAMMGNRWPSRTVDKKLAEADRLWRLSRETSGEPPMDAIEALANIVFYAVEHGAPINQAEFLNPFYDALWDWLVERRRRSEPKPILLANVLETLIIVLDKQLDLVRAGQNLVLDPEAVRQVLSGVPLSAVRPWRPPTEEELASILRLFRAQAVTMVDQLLKAVLPVWGKSIWMFRHGVFYFAVDRPVREVHISFNRRFRRGVVPTASDHGPATERASHEIRNPLAERIGA